MTLGQLIQSAKLKSAHTPIKNLDIELLLTHVLDCERVYLYTHRDQKLHKKNIQQFHKIFELRKTGMPLAYILNKKGFYGKEFIVKPGVFIPRPDTETLVSAVIKQQKDTQKKLNIIDFGSGSGCVGLSLLTHFRNAQLISIDLNKKALEISRINAKNQGVEDRVMFLNKNVLTLNTQQTDINKKIDIIVANPPYISFTDNRVQKEVVSFEPPEALFSQEEGFYHIRSWLNTAARLLKNGGTYFCEIGEKQNLFFLKTEVNTMKKQAEYKDLSGIVRVIQFKKHYG